MKTKILIIITTILGIILLALSIFYIYDYNKIKNKNNIVSVITIDINPSIEVSLNKDNEIVKLEALNDDAEILLKNEYKGITFESFISNLVVDLKENEIITNNVEILISVEGNINAKEIIETTFKSNEIECIVIEPTITETSKEYAIKYNISPAKAAYIEEVLKEHDSLIFEDLKDKAINEITNPVTPSKTEEQTTITVPTLEVSSSSSNQSSEYPPPPSNPSSSEWCSWNANRPQWYNYTYEGMMNSSSIYSHALETLGLSNMDIIGNWTGGPIYEPRSSYCLAYKAIITTRSQRTTLLFDSVTGAIVERNIETVPTPAITSEQAVDLCLNYFSLNKEDCVMCVANYSTNGEGGPNFYYRYDVSLTMTDGTFHIINVNATTGNIVNVVR